MRDIGNLFVNEITHLNRVSELRERIKAIEEKPVDLDNLEEGASYLVKTDYGWYAGVFCCFYMDIVALILPLKDKWRAFDIEIPKNDIKSIKKLT